MLIMGQGCSAPLMRGFLEATPPSEWGGGSWMQLFEADIFCIGLLYKANMMEIYSFFFYGIPERPTLTNPNFILSYIANVTGTKNVT